MIYAVIIGGLLLVAVITIVVRDLVRHRRDHNRIHQKIHDKQMRSYAFLIDHDFQVVETNYYELNPDVEKAEPLLLGNVLRCQTGTDCGKCGTGLACQTCPVRYVIKNAFQQKRRFDHMEAKMNLYDAVYKAHSVAVELDGELAYYKDEPHMLITAITQKL